MRWFGQQIEDIAEQYLRKKKLVLIEKNFYSKFGEIDLIMQDGETLCFIEVRHRKNTAFGSAAESITEKKQQKIVKTALYFIQTHQEYQALNYRFDALLSQGEGKSNTLEWIKNAF